MVTMPHPEYIAHADWGTDPKKRQVATATRTSEGSYRVISLAPADPAAVADGDLRGCLQVPIATHGQLLAGFDFPTVPHGPQYALETPSRYEPTRRLSKKRGHQEGSG